MADHLLYALGSEYVPPFIVGSIIFVTTDKEVSFPPQELTFLKIITVSMNKKSQSSRAGYGDCFSVKSMRRNCDKLSEKTHIKYTLKGNS